MTVSFRADGRLGLYLWRFIVQRGSWRRIYICFLLCFNKYKLARKTGVTTHGSKKIPAYEGIGTCRERKSWMKIRSVLYETEETRARGCKSGSGFGSSADGLIPNLDACALSINIHAAAAAAANWSEARKVHFSPAGMPNNPFGGARARVTFYHSQDSISVCILCTPAARCADERLIADLRVDEFDWLIFPHPYINGLTDCRTQRRRLKIRPICE